MEATREDKGQRARVLVQVQQVRCVRTTQQSTLTTQNKVHQQQHVQLYIEEQDKAQEKEKVKEKQEDQLKKKEEEK